MTIFTANTVSRRFLPLFVLLAGLCIPQNAHAALSFCNRTAGAIETAVGYFDDKSDGTQVWTSEGWWRIEPGQCARVYGYALSRRFYYYYARAMTQTIKNRPPTIWGGKYGLCTDNKAFKAVGDGNCSGRNLQELGFAELDVGGSAKDYTLDFRDGSTPAQ